MINKLKIFVITIFLCVLTNNAYTFDKKGSSSFINEIKTGVKQSYVAGKIQNTLLGGNDEIQMLNLILLLFASQKNLHHGQLHLFLFH